MSSNRNSSKRVCRLWEEKEDNILRQYYPLEGNKVSTRLTERSKCACKRRALFLGIHKKEYFKKWTAKEDRILKKYYPSEKGNVYKRLPGRTKNACQIRVRKRGIQLYRRGKDAK